ncbi:hypothetical protein [Microbacterium sp. KR10-403]|uniref:hypothetical protein n=1 Tax=Microbacterium sp. KR10-403 TaxID=3158581 RepID=UPI0032E4E34C
MKIDLTATMKSADDFFALFEEGDQRELFNGMSLLRRAIMNTKPDARYAIADFLLDRDAVIGPVGDDGTTLLHVLFGHVKHDVEHDAALAARLIGRGVDVNTPDGGGVLAFQWVLNMKYTDEELAPIYDLWFAQPVLDFTSRSSRYGVSPLEVAEKLPYREKITARMKEYIREHS